jgi:tetratricopeptide (TPR) repeat protein
VARSTGQGAFVSYGILACSYSEEKFCSSNQIGPNNADAYYFLGTLYNFRHNPAMAIEYLKKASNADSQEADTHFRLAKAFHNVDMVANAMLEYKRMLEIKPAYTKAINEIGWIYYNKGDKENAVAQWKKTLKINRNDRDAILNLAKAFNDLAWNALKSGKTKEAIKYWGKTITINPGNKPAKYYLKKYNLG